MPRGSYELAWSAINAESISPGNTVPPTLAAGRICTLERFVKSSINYAGWLYAPPGRVLVCDRQPFAS